MKVEIVGYSLNDNNLKLIMSYIDYFVKENNVTGRTPHYLAVSGISNKVKNIDYSDYIKFIFEPDKFDYSKVDTANIMWCNFFNVDEYRNILLKHKSDYWDADKEKRIELGFGSSFEHRVVYKYLFE